MKRKIVFGLLAAVTLFASVAHAASEYTFRVYAHGVTAAPQSSALYAFTSFTFTPCGTSGVSGPNLAKCQAQYAAAPWAQNPSSFSVTTGVQSWVVPATGNYQITVAGAAGGNGTNYATVSQPGYGGNGAVLTAVVPLTQGTALRLMVGQKGSSSSLDGGGGGGTFVAIASNPVMVAGGGGGATPNPPYRGDNASLTTSGTCGYGTQYEGTNGNGGFYISNSEGAGGSGFTGNGASTGNYGGQSYSFLNGGVSSGTSNACGIAAPGGFGGGGGAGCWGGGGGGGFSGGCGGGEGGGGGSYYTGSLVSSAVTNTGDGYITITKQ